MRRMLPAVANVPQDYAVAFFIVYSVSYICVYIQFVCLAKAKVLLDGYA